jgi:dinuclear metal center YbgI/SA1388 family protein
MASTIAALVSAMEAIAPPRWAARWDNVGLLVGDAGSPLTRVLLTIDCTREVVAEARRRGAEAIVAYHPVVFDAQKRFVAPSQAFEAARAGIAVYSPHTALDAAAGGTNDVLADLLGMQERRPLRGVDAGDAEIKLVTFVPAEKVDVVSQAVFAAGAGHIGKYAACSFRSPGTGTFFGEEGANPVVGQAGRLEEAPELRLETVVPVSNVPEVVRALRASHPYEEPAFDLVRLAPAPSAVGFGRVGMVTAGPVRSFVDKVKAGLGAEHVLVTGSLDSIVSRAAVCAGSGGELLQDAAGAGAQLFVTGELRHHDALAAVALGLTVVCALHSTSERKALVALEKRLGDALAGVEVARSEVDREPFTFV